MIYNIVCYINTGSPEYVESTSPLVTTSDITKAKVCTNEKQIKELNALNFYYEEAGGSGHPKLVYIQNGKSLVFAISSTPSDKRGYLNWISKVIHTIAENPND